MFNPVTPVPSHVHDHFVHLLPSVSQVQRQTRGRSFDVSLGSGSVRGLEAGPDERGAETAAVVGRVDGENVEDWCWPVSAAGERKRGVVVVVCI